MNYKDTVLTPKTDFPMRAGLVENEPRMQARWAEQRLYDRIRKARAGRPRWILHDGPPYANGDIHMGHVVNKVLKDLVVKYQTMRGLDSPYVPGWDCHGLPIEHKVMTEHGAGSRNLGHLQIRRECHAHARKYIDLQSRQFQRLGIFGEFERPYLTMEPAYEAAVLEVFADLVDQDLVYRQLKPVHWCIDCGTALAEAELEYQDRTDTSVYVNFRVTAETRARLADLPADAAVSFMIWTTTPWTLPANMAIAVHPEFEYALVSYQQAGRPQISFIAQGLVEPVMTAAGIGEYRQLGRYKGAEMAGWTYQHPFMGRTGPILLADYVTLRDDKGQPTGTGLVHTAPGHGAEDYHLGQQNGIEIYSPVNDDGTFDGSTPEWIRGRSVWEGNSLICRRLADDGHMFREHKFEHSYPHCWRSKTPTVFRCTEQWFIRVDQRLPSTQRSLREMAESAIAEVQWVPEWGQARIAGMLAARPDWCISRQRAWGLPIPSFYDPQGRPVLTGQTVRRVAAHFREHGSDAWFRDPPEVLLGDCPLPNGLRAAELTKENDIFDVWFESGSSWAAVCRQAGWDLPVELYLEGSDQHRGWFQLSLLPALGSIHRPPFKAVLTHGFVVDDQGKKMSKALGNVVDPQKEIAKYGADVLRLWVASIDYQNDIRCSDSLIQSLQDEYRKVRNTIRYLLGALRDYAPAIGVDHVFDPAADGVEVIPNSVDAWARLRLHRLVEAVTRLYGEYAYYKVFKQIHDFCNIDLSQVYIVAVRDRLYCDAPGAPRRRQTQRVMHEIADHLIRLVAPILVHTAEEAWTHLPAPTEKADSVHLAHLPAVDPAALNSEVESNWALILELRESAMLQLEKLKREAGMTNPLDAQAVYHVSAAQARMLEAHGEDPADVLGVGSYRVETTGGQPRVVIEDVRDRYAKCARSWKRRPDVGVDPAHPELSRRDAEVVSGLPQ